MGGGASEATKRTSGAFHFKLSTMFLLKVYKASILLSNVPNSRLTHAFQEQEALRELQPKLQAPPDAVKTKHTLGSTLLTLGIVAGVIGLLLVPLMSH